MNTLNDLRKYLYRAYFNNNDPLLVMEKTVNGKKIEMGYIDNLVMLAIKKHIPNYEMLALFGDTRIDKKIKELNVLVEEYISFHIQEKHLKSFIKDYEVDLNEIDLLTLQLVNDYMKRA